MDSLDSFRAGAKDIHRCYNAHIGFRYPLSRIRRGAAIAPCPNEHCNNGHTCRKPAYQFNHR